MAKTWDVELLEKRLCNDILIARFSRPEGYKFRAGQWFRLTLTTPAGDEVRTFSHASAPGDPYLEVATRLSSSAFKQALGAMTVGEHGAIVGPGGRLALPANTDRAVFLVGGVGVAPVRSILRDALQTGARFSDVLVVYGSRTASCVPYLEELEAMGHAGVRVVPVYESGEDDWMGEIGFITADVVRRHLDGDDGRPFVVAGPPVMVTAMQLALDELALSAERRIIESFGSS